MQFTTYVPNEIGEAFRERCKQLGTTPYKHLADAIHQATGQKRAEQKEWCDLCGAAWGTCKDTCERRRNAI